MFFSPFQALVCMILLILGASGLPVNNTLQHVPSYNIEDYFDGEGLQVVSKRTMMQASFSSQSSLPWNCAQQGRWRLLGERFYPSRIREIECLSSTCWYEHYNCTTVHYSALILHMCNRPYCNDHRVPLPLRSSWEFTNFLVHVGCMCSTVDMI